MPIRVSVNGQVVTLTPGKTAQKQAFPEKITSVVVDRNYYVNSEQLKLAGD
jgi:hypothetical protein